MVAELFVDTSAWYPLVVRSHPRHAPLAGALRDAVRRGTRVVTTNLIVAETHALLLRRTSRETALVFARGVAQPPNLEMPGRHDWQPATEDRVQLGVWQLL